MTPERATAIPPTALKVRERCRRNPALFWLENLRWPKSAVVSGLPEAEGEALWQGLVSNWEEWGLKLHDDGSLTEISEVFGP